VAELAAAGDTTRQIADALFISTKTVEANLTRIYRKLDVVNRAQLAARMSEARES
jgi:DNA-binding CsgD family transcriptional regulator